MCCLNQTVPTGREICHADCCLSISLPAKLVLSTTSWGDNRHSIRWVRFQLIHHLSMLYFWLTRKNWLQANNLSLQLAYHWAENAMAFCWITFPLINGTLSEKISWGEWWGGSVSIMMVANGWLACITVSRFIRHSSKCSRNVSKRINDSKIIRMNDLTWVRGRRGKDCITLVCIF